MYAHATFDQRDHPHNNLQLEEFKKKKQARTATAPGGPSSEEVAATNGQQPASAAVVDEVRTPDAVHTATADYATPDTTRAMWGTPNNAAPTPAHAPETVMQQVGKQCLQVDCL